MDTPSPETRPICAACQNAIADDGMSCAVCQTPHHTRCIARKGHCAGCGQAKTVPVVDGAAGPGAPRKALHEAAEIAGVLLMSLVLWKFVFTPARRDEPPPPRATRVQPPPSRIVRLQPTRPLPPTPATTPTPIGAPTRRPDRVTRAMRQARERPLWPLPTESPGPDPEPSAPPRPATAPPILKRATARTRLITPSSALVYRLPVVAIALAGDGKRIVVETHPDRIAISDPATGENLCRARASVDPYRPRSLVGFGRDGRAVVHGRYEPCADRLNTWNPSVTVAWAARARTVGGLYTFSASGRFFSTGASGGCLIQEMVPGGSRHFVPKLPSGLFSAAFSPVNDTFAVGFGNGSIALFDGPTGRPVRQLARAAQSPLTDEDTRAMNFQVVALEFSPDGRRLVSVSPNDRAVRLWDVATGQLEQVIEQEGFPWAATFSPDGRSLAVSITGGIVKVSDLASEEVRLVLDSGLRDHRIDLVAWSSDGKTLATRAAEAENTVLVWRDR
ncbi:MAG: hypothetical protein HY815_00945 [Candidatus Riflebacteria bacterium]|nr:hypothetical protein [Candidatus Riflebacteria bacterium]